MLTLNLTPLIVTLKWYLFIVLIFFVQLMKSKRICEISGFVVFLFFTYPLFLEISDFIGFSDYVFYDFNNNPLAVKILFLMQPEKPYNQAVVVPCFLLFHCLFILVVVLLVFIQIPICR